MTSYKYARRSFIAGTGAAVGLHTLLGGMEAQAAAAAAPKRLLVTHHPVGTNRYAWAPTGSGTTYKQSRILQPFEDAGLRNDMIIVDGLNMDTITGPGGGHEKGTVIMMTGTPTKGTRSGQTETDDAASAGPSYDQLLLALKPNDLAKQTFSSLYALCDDRVDFREISTRCMRYSMAKRTLSPAINKFSSGESPYENTPLMGELKPLNLYTTVFGSIMTGGATDANAAALARARAGKKSVLDFSLKELTRLRTLAPASSKALLDAHEDAIRSLEKQFDVTGVDPGKCTPPAKPADVQAASYGNTDHNNYGNDKAPSSDETVHQQIGELHQAVLLAALQCDLTRVALFQWSPGTNHVAFSGQYPGQPSAILMHHPVSHRITNKNQEVQTNNDAEFLVNIEIWYNKRMATFFNKLKAAKDPFDPQGGSIFDNTCIPYVTEVAETTHSHSPMPLTMFGGKNLGFHGGQYFNFSGRPYNDLWLTILAAFGVTLDDLKAIQVNGAAGATMLKAPYTKALEGVQG